MKQYKENQNNIFISGSAEEYGVFTKEEAEDLIKLLSARLIQDEFNIISGFGIGVGSAVITGTGDNCNGAPCVVSFLCFRES